MVGCRGSISQTSISSLPNWVVLTGPRYRVPTIDFSSSTTSPTRPESTPSNFGGEFHRDSFTGGAYGGVRGRIKFGFNTPAFPGATSLEDYFAGVADSGSLLTGDPTRHIHNWGYALFGQDDWRITKTLTLNLGLRYELNTVVKEEHDLLGNFDPTRGLVQVGQGISGPYNSDRNNVAPRFGFALDLEGERQNSDTRRRRADL